jgi:hypothetical protein
LQNGIALPEDMVCSTYPSYGRRFKDYDKVIPTWHLGFPYAGDMLQRGTKDRLIYKPVGKIQQVSKTNPETGAVTKWIQDIDYIVRSTQNRDIQWVSGKGPALDEFYAVTYEPRFEFIAWSPLGLDGSVDEIWDGKCFYGRRIFLGLLQIGPRHENLLAFC